MRIEACIFDLDGVIVDTAKYHFIAWSEIANSLGFDFSAKHNERLKGVSRMRSLDILLEIGGIELNNNEKVALADYKNKLYRNHILQIGPEEILPGIIDFLQELRDNNIRIALGSASKNAKTILDLLKINQYFDSIIDGNKVQNAKPDPEVFLKGAEELQVNPNVCIVFEDAFSGIEAANTADMTSIGVGKKEDLPNAQYIISGFHNFNYAQLIEIIEKNVTA